MSVIQSHPCFLTPQKLQPDYPLFVFLPGMDGTGQLLRSQTDGLEATFDVRCLAIPLDDLTNWDILAERIVALIQEELKRSPNRPVYLCGESFGGCLAIKVALHSPHLFDRIILVNPASSFNARPLIGWGGQIARWLPGPLFQFSSMALMTFLGNMEHIAPGDRKAFEEAIQSVPQATTVWRLFLLSEFKVAEAELRRLRQPILLIASAADRLLPSVEESYRLTRVLPDSKVVVLPNSGHACLLEVDVNLYEIMKTNHFLTPQNSTRSSTSRVAMLSKD